MSLNLPKKNLQRPNSKTPWRARNAPMSIFDSRLRKYALTGQRADRAQQKRDGRE